jgi:UDP-N-acetylglucosamine 1-carboxyvinyltransferase
MRASFLVLGPLLARFGAARVSEPGGCAIGVRPVDQHLKGLRALGAKLTLDHGYVEATAARLTGGRVTFDLNTVNGTQNVMMAACLAEGETVIENAAREPEVVELAHVLQKMGAEIHGAGSDRITVQGVRTLRGVRHTVAGDRIEAGTLLAAAVTRAEVRVTGVDPANLRRRSTSSPSAGPRSRPMRTACGCTGRPAKPLQVTTARSGLPTDMQAQLMATLRGAGRLGGHRTSVREPLHARARAAAHGRHITLSGRAAHVRRRAPYRAQVMATDLRASAAWSAALAAKENYHQPRLPHRSRLRAHRGEAAPPRRGHPAE